MSSSEQKKKREEKKFLEEFGTLSGLFTPDCIRNYERPDFIVKMDGDDIGIEITKFVHGRDSTGSIQRGLESSWSRILDIARKYYEKEDKPPVVVYIHWLPNKYPAKGDWQHIARQLAYYVSENCPAIERSPFTNQFVGDFDNPLQEYLSSITITKTNGKSDFLPVSAGFINVVPEHLQAILDEKNVSLLKYSKRPKMNWLLIVAGDNPGFISSHVSLERESLEHKYNSDFQRVFFYDRLDDPYFVKLKTISLGNLSGSRF